jgi:uncharacterized protein YjbI with pentapeptide repeats
MQTASYRYTPIAQQRSGGIDPAEALKACNSIVQKTPELIELCKQAQEAGGSGWWQDGLPQGAKDISTLVSTFGLGGLGAYFGIKANIFKNIESRLSAKKLKHIAAQKEPTIDDLKTNDIVYQLCNQWEKTGVKPRTSEITLAQEQIKTCFRAMWEGEATRKQGGSTITDEAINMYGLEIVGLNAPSRLHKWGEQLRDASLKRNINNPETFQKKFNRLNKRLNQIKAQRALLKTPAERQAFNQKNPHLVRLNGKGGNFQKTTWVNCDIDGMNLENAFVNDAAFIGSSLRFNNGRRLNAKSSQWLVCNLESFQGKGIQAQHSQWFQTDLRYAIFRPAMENGLPNSDRRYYQRADFTGMKVHELNYNKAEKRWVKARENNFSYMEAQAGIFKHCDWNNVNISHAKLGRFDPKPPPVVTEQPDYTKRTSRLTPTPIWETIKDEETRTTFHNSVWRNVNAQNATMEGARMTNMQFPCEIETLDGVVKPKELYDYTWYGKKKERKPSLMTEDGIDYQQPYLRPTDDIQLGDTDLSNSVWDGTYLNAKSELTNAVESRLRFEGADLSGADFTKAKLLHPLTQQHLDMRIAVEHINGLNDEERKTDALFKHLKTIFEGGLDKGVPKVIDNPEQDEKFVRLLLPVDTRRPS